MATKKGIGRTTNDRTVGARLAPLPACWNVGRASTPPALFVGRSRDGSFLDGSVILFRLAGIEIGSPLLLLAAGVANLAPVSQVGCIYFESNELII